MTDPTSNQKPCGLFTCWLKVFRSCATSRCLHALAHLSWIFVKLVAVLVFIAWAIGVPGSLVVKRIQPSFAPYDVAIDRITWSPLRGVIIHHPEIREPSLSSEPIISAVHIVIKPDYRAWLDWTWNTRRIDVKGGRMLFPVSQTNSGVAIVDYIVLNDVEGEVENGPHGMRINMSAVTDIGTRCLLSGVIRTPDPRKAKPDAEPIARKIAALHTSFYRTPDWIIALRERIDSMEFEQAPELSIVFQADPDQWNATRASLAIKAGSFAYRGQSYSGFEADLRMTGPRFDIEQAKLFRAEKAFQVTGFYVRTNDVFEAHVRNNLPMDTVSVFFPASWSEKMTNAGLAFSGTLDAEAWFGPCPIRDVPANWTGWISIQQAAINDLAITRAFASAQRTGPRFTLRDGVLEGGKGLGRGTIAFSSETDLDAHITEADLDLGIELRQLKPILPGTLRWLADQFDIREKSLEFKGHLQIPHRAPEYAVVTGATCGTNVSFRGVDLTGYTTRITYSNRVLVLDPFIATFPTGAITGALSIDFPGDLYGIHLDITTNPRKASPMAGKKVAAKFAPFVFTDDVAITAEGFFKGNADEGTDIAVSIAGRQIGISNLICERASADARLTPGHLVVSNIQAAIFQGGVTGSLQIGFSDQSTNFAFASVFTNLNMDRLVKNFARDSTNFYEGTLSGHLNLSGPFPDRPGWRNLGGTGSIDTRDGRLLRIPMLGGLSSLLSKIYPGFGFAEQNHLTATLSIHDGAVYTEDLKLLGSVLSLSANGRYTFADQLSFKVQVKPLRDGIIASTVRIVTTPLSLLLEFKVSGSSRKPTWEAANLPL